MKNLRFLAILVAIFLTLTGYSQGTRYKGGILQALQEPLEKGLLQYTRELGVTEVHVQGSGNEGVAYYYRFEDGLAAGNYDVVISMPKISFKGFSFMSEGERQSVSSSVNGASFTIEDIEIEIYHRKSGFSRKHRFSVTANWDEGTPRAYSALAFTQADIEQFRAKPNPQAFIRDRI